MERVKFDILGKLKSERGHSDSLALATGMVIVVFGVGILLQAVTMNSNLHDIKNKLDENSLALTPVTSDPQLTPTPQP